MTEEQLDDIRQICEEILIGNLRLEETVRKLMEGLKTCCPSKYVYDAVIEGGAGKIYRWEMDPEILKRKRVEALERHRVETANLIEPNQSEEGYDEIDESRLEN